MIAEEALDMDYPGLQVLVDVVGSDPAWHAGYFLGARHLLLAGYFLGARHLLFPDN